MKPEESDQMYFELINLLLENNLYGAADTALDKILDVHTNQYLLTKSKLRMA